MLSSRHTHTHTGIGDLHRNGGTRVQHRPQQTHHRQSRAQPLARHSPLERPVAEEGRLGWTQDQTAASYEGLRQPALDLSQVTQDRRVSTLVCYRLQCYVGLENMNKHELFVQKIINFIKHNCL